jgi:hypothetical protein
MKHPPQLHYMDHHVKEQTKERKKEAIQLVIDWRPIYTIHNHHSSAGRIAVSEWAAIVDTNDLYLNVMGSGMADTIHSQIQEGGMANTIHGQMGIMADIFRAI